MAPPKTFANRVPSYPLCGLVGHPDTATLLVNPVYPSTALVEFAEPGLLQRWRCREASAKPQFCCSRATRRPIRANHANLSSSPADRDDGSAWRCIQPRMRLAPTTTGPRRTKRRLRHHGTATRNSTHPLQVDIHLDLCPSPTSSPRISALFARSENCPSKPWPRSPSFLSPTSRCWSGARVRRRWRQWNCSPRRWAPSL